MQGLEELARLEETLQTGTEGRACFVDLAKALAVSDDPPICRPRQTSVRAEQTKGQIQNHIRH